MKHRVISLKISLARALSSGHSLYFSLASLYNLDYFQIIRIFCFEKSILFLVYSMILDRDLRPSFSFRAPSKCVLDVNRFEQDAIYEILMSALTLAVYESIFSTKILQDQLCQKIGNYKKLIVCLIFRLQRHSRHQIQNLKKIQSIDHWYRIELVERLIFP